MSIWKGIVWKNNDYSYYSGCTKGLACMAFRNIFVAEWKCYTQDTLRFSICEWDKNSKKSILYVEPLVWFTFRWWSEARFRFDVQATEVTLFGSGDGTGHKYSDRRVVPVQGDWMESGGFDLCIVYRSSWVGKYDKPKSAQSSLALLSRLYRPVGWGASQLSLCFIQFH